MTRARAVLFVALALVVGACAAPRRPNLIVVLADDLGFGDLSCYGQRRFTTPQLDRLAREGLRFTTAYAGSTVCAPSRATLLTGRHTGHVWQRANGPIAFREDPDDRCIAATLRDAGYRTALIGKSGLSCASTDGALPNRKGFDHFFGFVDHVAAHRYYPSALWRDGVELHYDDNHGDHGAEHASELFLADALDWIDANRDAPFFLLLSLQQPHADLVAPAPWRARFAGRFDEVPQHDEFARFYRHEPQPRATFAAMVAHLDDQVGRLAARLHALGIDDDTLLVFTSDNGPHAEGGHDPAFFASSGGLRGKKRDLYEGGLRVPLIAHWPGVIAPGRTSDHVLAFWDLAPTFCELAGAPSPADTDGISFVPELRGEGEQRTHESLYWEFWEQGGKQAVRLGDWKGVRLGAIADPDGPIALFDLARDPGETEDVAARHPELVARIAAVMAREHVPTERYAFSR
ncbi:MAG: arylsulfatase [Planctomycetes bacterium]|nr:arylsulfatase [Planctomycetota bacterium]